MNNVRIKFIKSGATIGVGQAIGQVCSLGRNIIVARLISPTDFGIAAIFLSVVLFLEMISNLSLDRLLVQSPDGNTKRFQQTAHFLQALRGIVSSILLLLLAKPISILFSIPDTYPAFCVLAIIPLFNGFCHLDPRRMERDMRYLPYVSVEVFSQILLLILAWPVAIWLGDYRSMLLLLIIKILVMLIGSHYVAEREYRWAADVSYIKRFFKFGWPLLVNGVLLFVILQGDRLIIGSAKSLFGTYYTMEDVGLYSSAFMITMVPAMMLVNVMSALTLPKLSKISVNQKAFEEMYETSFQFAAFVSVVVSLLLVVVGPLILITTFGEKYHSAVEYIPWLALMWMIRILRALPATASMASGRTTTLMNSNLVRMAAFPLIVVIVAMGKSLVLVAIAGLLGEMAALSATLVLNHKNNVTRIYCSLRPLTVVMLLSFITVAIHNFNKDTYNLLTSSTFFLMIALVYTLFLVITLPTFRRISLDLITEIITKGKGC